MWPALTFIYATVCDSLIYSFVMRWVKKEVSSAHGCGRKWTSLVVCRRVFSKSWPTFVMCYMLQQLYYSFLLNINECAENSLANMSYISNIGCIVLVELTQEKKNKRETKNTVCVASGTQSLRFIPTLRRQYFMHHFLGYLHWFIFKTQISLCNMQCIRLPLSRLVLLLSFLPSIAVCPFSTERETRYF